MCKSVGVDTKAHRIGAALRAARESREMAREHVAAAMRERGYSTSTNTVLRWEATGRVQVAELLDLAAIFEMPPCDFLAAAFAHAEIAA